MFLAQSASKPVFLHTDDDDTDDRPQLVSRHSSCLPVNRRNETKKKALSRRSRSASPCIKKTYSTHSGGTPGCNYEYVKKTPPISPQLPTIRKQSSYASGKNIKVPRSSLSGSKQRLQVLNDHKKSFRASSVWESISSVKSVSKPITDINSNLSYIDENTQVHGWDSKTAYSYQSTCGGDSTYKSNDVKTQVSIDNLPLECKLKIASYLNQMDKGKCMFLSRSWYHIIRTPLLWRDANLREFRLCYGHYAFEQPLGLCHAKTSGVEVKTLCDVQCYSRYIDRINRYIYFLIDIQANIRRLEFSFDLLTDSWRETVGRIFCHMNLSCLEYVDIDWHNTPIKPPYLLPAEHGIQDIMYKTRRRVRLFLDFLEQSVHDMPNVNSLILQFPWYRRAMKYLASFKNLKNLVLKKYTVFQPPCQELLDELGKMPCLEKLLIEVWMSASDEPAKFDIRSPTLKYLDLSQCRSFYLQSIDLPSLEVLIIGTKSRTSAIKNQGSLPCLGKILLKGAPALQWINQTQLARLNKVDLEFLLDKICPCSFHTR